MRVGVWEVALQRVPGGDALPEVRAPDGDVYAVAEPGAVFEVRVTCHSPPRGARHAPDAKMLCALEVDGRDVGVLQLVACAPGAFNVFKGFLLRGDMAGVEYSAFRFAAAVGDAAAAGEVRSADELPHGRLRVTAWAAAPAGAVEKSYAAAAAAPPPRARAVAALPEGKKWFTAPSLQAEAGPRVSSGGFNTTRYTRVGAPLAELELRYEAAAMLLLRGVLRRGVPRHDAILDLFPETRAGAHGDDGDEGGGGGGGGGARGPRVKREAVDLTVDPADEVVAAALEGAELECDLTGAGDAPPRWTKRPRAEHDLGSTRRGR